MNENNPVPPLIPPTDAAQRFADKISDPLSPPPGLRPLGEDPAERVAIPHAFAAIEALLRQPRRLMFQLRSSLIRAWS